MADAAENLDITIKARAEWDTAYINDLPDSAFAVILPGGEKDADGKTTPRDLRKLPHHDASGAVDGPHLRNALSREPQTDMPESDHEQARAHLARHMTDEVREEDLALATRTANVEAVVEVRDEAKREIEVRLLPWGKQIETILGPEEFSRGAFADAVVSESYLYGVGHEARMGIGQDGKPVLTRVPVGRGFDLRDDPSGPIAAYRVARTASGDETLALARDGIVTGVSVEFQEVPGGTVIQQRNGRRVRVHTRARLTGATLTHRPAYGEQATVLAVRSQAEKETTPMVEAQEAPVAGADVAAQIEAAFVAIEARAAKQEKTQAEFYEKLLARVEKSEEQARMSIEIPNPTDAPKTAVTQGEWLQVWARIAMGEQVPDSQMRAIADVITGDNPGVVPPAYLTELIGVIDTSRPFLATTRRLPTPDSGMTLRVPVINQRPLAGVQATEKSEVASRKTLIGTEDFDAVTIAGAGDLSLQIIRRSSPNFLNLWLELLAEAYAITAEDEATSALLNAIGGVGAAGPLDPENLSLGDAYVSSFDAIRRPPDTIWLSTQAVGEFIDAKATTTNQPLYGSLTASASAAGGISGTISGLRAVHVPTLDAHGAYAIVGPSSGFAWAEDGTYTLQADVPTKAGRDVALVSIMWFAPWYPAAFTAYNVAS